MKRFFLLCHVTPVTVRFILEKFTAYQTGSVFLSDLFDHCYMTQTHYNRWNFQRYLSIAIDNSKRFDCFFFNVQNLREVLRHFYYKLICKHVKELANFSSKKKIPHFFLSLYCFFGGVILFLYFCLSLVIPLWPLVGEPMNQFQLLSLPLLSPYHHCVILRRTEKATYRNPRPKEVIRHNQ